MNLNILSWNILSNKWIRPEFYNNIDIKALNDPNRYIKIIDYITNINYDIILAGPRDFIKFDRFLWDFYCA